MHIAFSKVLKTPKHQLEFNFLKLDGEQSRYYADVTDERGQRIIFSMLKNGEGHWAVGGQNVPVWISSMEEQLGLVIDEEHNHENDAQ